MEWIERIFASPEFGIAALPAAFLLGLMTAVNSACNLGLIAAVAGFSGGQGGVRDRRDAWFTSLFFLAGTTIALTSLGLLVSFFGQFVGANFGRYGQLLAGIAAVFFGLVTLDFLPFRLPSLTLTDRRRPSGFGGAALFGLVVGAASISCTLICCGPLLPVVLGVAAARGQMGWGTLILGMFALGYSLPLAALMLGMGLGRLTSAFQKAIKPIRIVAGLVLLGAGFWLLGTL